MSNSTLDFEFEQVLGSWFDHCSESLSLQQQQHNLPSSTLELLQQNDNTGMLLVTPSLLLHFKKEMEQDSALPSAENENTAKINKLDDSTWLLTARSTIDRFKSMIPDNMEKLREIFKVIFTRVRDSTAQATSQFLVFLKRQKIQSTSNRDDDDEDEDQQLDNISNKTRNVVFLPKRFSGVSRNKSNNNNNHISRQTAQHQQQQHFSILEPSPELAHLIRRSIFYWLIFDTLIQAFPLVACQWCIQCRDDFFSLVEHALPWEYACEWCDFTVLNCWVPLFRNFSGSSSSFVSSSSSSATTSMMTGDFASRLEAIAMQRRASVVLAQSLAAEQSRKRRIEMEESKIRDASTQEMRQLHELAQRLISALNRHKPNDGRLAVVKLENVTNNEGENEDDDPFRVKKENFHVESTRLKAQALHFKDIGNNADGAWDVDEEYEPGYVAGAQMGNLKKLGNVDDDAKNNQNTKNEDAALTASNNTNNKNAENDELQQGGRRAPRVRPR